MSFILKVVVILGGIILLILVGLKIKPAQLAPPPLSPGVVETMPLPEELPYPVERFYREVYGEEIPVITSAVFSGRATMRPVSSFPAFPSRFRFTHRAGQDYRHYMELTIFGIPLIKGNEHFIDGKGYLDLGPVGTSDGPEVDQAGNLGLWAESIWLPAVWLTDQRVLWQAIDDTSAIMIVPFEEAEEHVLLRFDPDTGLLRFLEVMRYRHPDEPGKILWICEALEWKEIDGYTLPEVGTITWFDKGSPWAVFHVEEIIYNADISEYLPQTGP